MRESYGRRTFSLRDNDDPKGARSGSPVFPLIARPLLAPLGPDEFRKREATANASGLVGSHPFPCDRAAAAAREQPSAGNAKRTILWTDMMDKCTPFRRPAPKASFSESILLWSDCIGSARSRAPWVG